MPKPTSNHLSLAERIHRACPCRKEWASRVPALSRCQYRFCACRTWEEEVAGLPPEAFADCLWQGHAIAGEVEEAAKKHQLLADAVNENSSECKPSCDSYGHAEDCEYVDMAFSLRIQQAKVAALTAKVAESHAMGCFCGSDKRPDGSPYLDPRCVEWRSK